MIDADGFTDERPRVRGTYWTCTPDGEWDALVAVEPGAAGLVCRVVGSSGIPPILLATIPAGSLLWRREA